MILSRRRAGTSLLFMAGLLTALAQPLPATSASVEAVDPDSSAAVIRMRVEAGRTTGQFWAAEQRLTAIQSLPAFYRGREFAPAWTARARAELLEGIREAANDGLDPVAYHLDAIARLHGLPTMTAAQAADLELLATDAFLVLGSHLLHGRVDPILVKAEWLADRRGADMAAVLERALSEGDVRGALDGLRPQQARYARMREEYAALRAQQAAAGSPAVADGPTLRTGDEGPRVGSLRARLAASGDLEASATSPDEVFDAEVEAAVIRFQLRHGLEPDGAVGPATRAALNIPLEQRMATLRVNLERWRWMPEELGRRHILVNIPDFSVTVREDGEVAMRLRGIVGREYRQTPVFSGRMSYLVLSPYWHVPPGIAANDKFPEFRRNPGAVAGQRMTLLDLRTNRAVDPHSLDWSSLTAAQFNQQYRLRQDPGPQNALGDVKFMFPNRHNVYLHDTPSRELFSRAERSFSSGCIRVERPLELAAYLLQNQSGWTPERIRRAVEGGTETNVSFTAPVPVHLQYWTAFVDDEGRLNYRRDLYSRDAAVLAALRSPPPGV